MHKWNTGSRGVAANSSSARSTPHFQRGRKYILAAAVTAILLPGYASAQEIEAEDTILNDVTVQNNHSGFSGTGFADYRGASGASMTWDITTDNPTRLAIDFRYALGAPASRTLDVEVNGNVVGPLTFETTGGWSVWLESSVEIETAAGNNIVRLVATGESGPNFDTITMTRLSDLTSDPTATPGTAFSCSSQAYLSQDQQTSTFSLNLLTGDYFVAAPEHLERVNGQPGDPIEDRLNAMGFNLRDHYVYGWSYEHSQPVRMHNDWSVELLEVVNITDRDFFVGDVSTGGSKYYVYRRGGDAGLFSVGLDPQADDYLQMVRIIDGDTLDLRIADFAFNPLDELLYAMDRDGVLHQIDPETGASRNLGDTGAGGGSPYGAAYFDGEGGFYAGRNNDGSIYRIDISSGVYTARLFSTGPSSTNNDGFRCALAPLIDVDNDSIDFGDAPPSYGTYLADNGARHGLLEAPDVRLGALADGESEAYAFPLSDNDGGSSDEDGVQFVTSMVENKQAITMVHANAVGYLNVWVDTDQNGTFDAGEQLVTDQKLDEGRQPVYMTIPDNIVEGDTWARFRFSSHQGLQAIGGAPDGEVEDYPVTLLKDSAIITSYPSKSDWTTVAFEDNWPLTGDYDMNDLVARLRTHTHRDESGVVRVVIEGVLAAAGADYENGFAIRLPGVPRDAIDERNIDFSIADRDLAASPLEPGRREAILVVTENMFNHTTPGEDCTFYRTEPGCGADPEFSFKMSVPFSTPQQVELSGVYDPFLFATPGAFHGAHFVSPPGRGYEIHLKNQSPTEAFDRTLFAGAGHDASQPDAGYYFQNANGMPWAIEIGVDWSYPIEFIEVSAAYPWFADYATSDGQQSVDWHLPENAKDDLLFSE